MLQQIIDRRLAGKNKSIGNRERFLRRYQGQLRDAVRKAVDNRGIRDIEKGEDIHLPKRDIKEHLSARYAEFIGKEIQTAYLESYSEYGQNIFDRYVTYADRKSTRLNSSHSRRSRMPSSA